MVYIPSTSRREASVCLEQRLAAKLKREILRGSLAPGQRILVWHWAHEYKIAETSVREAINCLVHEGFAIKASGQSARVTSYSEADIHQIYELRGVLEGLAARLIVQNQADLRPLDAALEHMNRVAKREAIGKIIEADLQFHLKLCEICDNPFLSSQIRILLVPFFAFIKILAAQDHQSVYVGGLS
jgi:DNA-binding GntR family transcriptional regulator